ncbi:hypothetical protein J6590_077962 [Homalodisca vitripennis]|nr:hypothetical protein J6590_077962 [Homalodisca vitripennis]
MLRKIRTKSVQSNVSDTTSPQLIEKRRWPTVSKALLKSQNMPAAGRLKSRFDNTDTRKFA